VPATGIHREDEDFGCLEGALGVAKFAEGNASDVLDFDNSADGLLLVGVDGLERNRVGFERNETLDLLFRVAKNSRSLRDFLGFRAC
jgi:hypothetical protein